MYNHTFILWILVVICQVIVFVDSAHYIHGMLPAWNAPWLEKLHDPRQYKPDREVNNTRMPPEQDTPDFRIEEDTWYKYTLKQGTYWAYVELERPFRISPAGRQLFLWDYYHPTLKIRDLGCYCTTVYKRYTLLAGCAVITRRHILTTASSTELVLKNYKDRLELEHILGAWYDMNDHTSWNSSVYMFPSRIHYHPRYIRAHEVNHTHPLPFMYDLSVWAATHDFYRNPMPKSIWVWKIIPKPYLPQAYVCQRGAAHDWQYLSSTPRNWDLALIVGFQFMKAHRRLVMPWFKYAVRTRDHIEPCPKTEWGWYHCLGGHLWAKYGIESGAAWHRALEDRYWLHDGLIGLNAFSLRLRSKELVNYFTVLNTHPVLEFIYDAYMGTLPYEFLDDRFWNTQYYAPNPKPNVWVKDYTGEYAFNLQVFGKKVDFPIY